MKLKEIKSFLAKKTKEIEIIYKNFQLAYWEAALKGKKELYEEYGKQELALKKFFNNPADFNKVKEFQEQEIDDEITARQIKLLYDSYLSYQGDFSLMTEITNKTTEVERKFNTERAEIGGKQVSDNELIKMLKTEKDNKKLRGIWEAGKARGQLVARDVIELVKLRNALARSMGFRDYYEFSLEVSEQKEQEIEKIFLELEKFTETPFIKLKQEIDEALAEIYKIKKENLAPWHYGDFYFQEGPRIYEVDLDEYYKKDILEKAEKYYKSIGMEVKDILERSSLYEQPNKYPHAFCIDIDRKGDVRTMQNLRNTERWIETLLHELGHGIYSKYIDASLPFLLRDQAHIFTTEAIAMLFGRKARNSEFIKNYCNIKEDEIKNIKETVKKILRMRELVFARWVQVMFHFERALYKDPEQDLNMLWWELVNRYQLLNFQRNEPDWASKIHLVSSPVYYHNYMLGEILASQLHHYITQNITHAPDSDYSGKEEVGKYLREKIFKPGARYRWDKLIELATGEPLTARYFIEEFS